MTAHTPSPASRLLSSSDAAVVLVGHRPASLRPWIAAAALSFVVTASLLPTNAQAFDFGFRRSTPASQQTANDDAQAAPKTAAGRIVGIVPTEIKPQSSRLAGTALGALVGGVIGNRLGGRGSSRTFTTAAGAVAGGAVGHEMAGGAPQAARAVQIFVEPDPAAGPADPNGQRHALAGVVSVTQAADLNYRIGDPVWVVGSDDHLRIVHRQVAATPTDGMAERLQARRTGQPAAASKRAGPRTP